MPRSSRLAGVATRSTFGGDVMSLARPAAIEKLRAAAATIVENIPFILISNGEKKFLNNEREFSSATAGGIVPAMASCLLIGDGDSIRCEEGHTLADRC